MQFCKSYILKLITLSLSMLLVGLITAGCQSKSKENEIKVGTIAGPETRLMEVAKDVAENKYGLKIDIITFSDYLMPNTALNDGNIDANMTQHQPYLDETIKNRHYDLVAIGKTFIYPMGIYSQKLKSISEIPTGGAIAIPNDPSNEARALLLLSKAKLIKLNPNAGINASVIDITDNPKHLKIEELDAAQLTRALPDVDLAVINTNYAVPAGLLPTKDALFMEDKNSPYANIVVVRKDNENDPKFEKLMEALHSPEVIAEAEKLFHNAAIPAWQ
jgi:D-methionine transport system substrate-binding protein